MGNVLWSYLRNQTPLTPYPYHGEPVACPVCGSDNHRPILQWDRRMKRLPTALCDDCGLFFTNPMPTDGELEAYYRDLYRLDYQFARLRPRANHVRRKSAEADARFAAMQPFLPDRTVRFLDFGCGSGELVKRFAAAGHEARGFEPGSIYADFGKSQTTRDGVIIDTARWEDLDYPQQHFDAIAMLHVLEHLRRPVAALKRLHDWLADDGFAFVEVPDMQSYPLKTAAQFHFAHVLGFSRANLILAAGKAGFSLAHAFGPTSMIFRKRAPAAQPDVSESELKFTAARNRSDYGAQAPVKQHVQFHLARMAYVVRTTLGRGAG